MLAAAILIFRLLRIQDWAGLGFVIAFKRAWAFFFGNNCISTFLIGRAFPVFYLLLDTITEHWIMCVCVVLAWVEHTYLRLRGVTRDIGASRSTFAISSRYETRPQWLHSTKLHMLPILRLIHHNIDAVSTYIQTFTRTTTEFHPYTHTHHIYVVATL